MAWSRAGVVGGAVGLVALVLLSGGTRADPRTPAGLPGLPPPFLGAAVVGDGRRMEAVDAYGDVVGLWAPGPAGRSLIYNPAARQAAGSVPADTGVVARMRVGGRSIPFWRAESVRQRYLAGTDALQTVARLRGRTRVVVRSLGGGGAARADRRWLARARPLAATAPRWARAMYRRSLLVLRALTDRRTGAVAAGARDGWAYVWPRDASAVAIALAAAGYRAEAGRVARFLRRLDLEAAARFRGTGAPVPGRGPQGDAAGWVAAAAEAAGLPAARVATAAQAVGPSRSPASWRDRPDYQEGDPGDYLGDAIAATGADGPKSRLYRDKSARRRGVAGVAAEFGTGRGLVREAGEPGSGLDSAAAWAVRPFQLRGLYPLARRTTLRLAARAGRYGIVPSEDWHGGDDPWTAPTAWTAWSLAALARAGATRERRAALALMADLRRAATPTGLLPERVDARTGAPRSTTPLAWSHAFAILALRELWPRARRGRR